MEQLSQSTNSSQWRRTSGRICSHPIIHFIDNRKLNFLDPDEIYEFIEDASFLKILNSISVGLSSYNCKNQVPSDVATEGSFIPTKCLKTQSYLQEISK